MAGPSEGRQLRIMVFGAHPDDADIKAGGTAAKWAHLGHHVRLISVTNGDAGHQEMAGAALAKRRKAEAEACGKILGVDYWVLDNHDGELEPTIANRRVIISLIREFDPDIVMLPRPNDYHPDHRYTSLLVQDAAYMVTVPNVAAFSPHLARNPVFMYVSDSFQRPYPFTPDVAVSIDDVVEQKFDAVHQHTSQIYEWLAYNAGRLHEVPAGDAERRAWLNKTRLSRDLDSANRYRDLLHTFYGPEQGAAVRYAEAFEICELGRRPDEQELRRLFPFFPTAASH